MFYIPLILFSVEIIFKIHVLDRVTLTISFSLFTKKQDSYIYIYIYIYNDVFCKYLMEYNIGKYWSRNILNNICFTYRIDTLCIWKMYAVNTTESGQKRVRHSLYIQRRICLENIYTCLCMCRCMHTYQRKLNIIRQAPSHFFSVYRAKVHLG